MKYKALSKSDPQSLTVKSLDGGLNSGSGQMADCQLSDCRNVWFRDGVLKTRPGLHSAESRVFLSDVESLYDEFLDLKLTDTSISQNGEILRLAYAVVCREDSRAHLYVYGIKDDQSVVPLGSMIFQRTSYNIFYIPYSAVFYTGKPIGGGGIFAFVSVRDIYNQTETYYNCFEINAQFDGWEQNNQYYVPTVYINGRGTRYELAKSNHQAFTGQPTVLEAPNLLGGRFHAYFSSDGYSSAFRLPFSELSNEMIACRFYHSLTEYTEWRIYAEESSNTQMLYGTNVTMTADRQKGIVYFTGPQGEYSLPFMIYYYENNIRITACKKEPGSPESILSCSCCAALNSGIVFSGGLEPGMVYSTTYANPLYFPKNAAYAAGISNQPVTALKVQGDRILAFKKNALYSLKLSKGRQINTKSLLSDNDTIFYGSDSFEEEKISGSIGCENPRTVVNCGSHTVWMGQDSAFYALSSGSGKEISRISESIRPLLAALPSREKKDAFAFGRDGTYLLMIGRKAFIMEYEPNGLKNPETPGGVKWFLWDFPESISVRGGMAENGGIQLLCYSGFPELCYLADLSGTADTAFRLTDSTLQPVYSEITSSFATREFDFGSVTRRKRIEKIFLSLAAQGEVQLRVNGKQLETLRVSRSAEAGDVRQLSVRRIYPALNGCRTVSLSLSSNQAMAVGELSLYYREIL